MAVRMPITIIVLLLIFGALLGCGRSKVFIGTGTLIGIEGSPGDPNVGQTPSVTFGYRRAETAFVPVKPENENNSGFSGGTQDSDAYSTLTYFELNHEILGTTTIGQSIATGHAAR